MKSFVALAAALASTYATASFASPPAEPNTPDSSTPAETEIRRGCMHALHNEKRAWIGKPLSMEVGVARPPNAEVTGRCRLTVRTGSPEGPMLTEYTVLLRVSDLYVLGVSSSQRPVAQGAQSEPGAVATLRSQ